MARQPNATRGRKVEPTIPAGAYDCLDYLAKRGRLGSTITDVARSLIIQSINELTRDGILPPELPKDGD
jgi:hypothetical protein